MHILTINTSKPELELGLYKDLKQIDYLKVLTNNQLSEVLYQMIEDFLVKHSLSVETIDALNCFRGPGSFTGLRIGLSVANAIAYSLNKQIIGSLGKDWINDGNKKLLAKSNDQMVLPFYGADVKVTTPKK